MHSRHPGGSDGLLDGSLIDGKKGSLLPTPCPYPTNGGRMRGQTGTPQLLRTMNERLLLDRLREHGPASRGDLAKATGLSKPTVSAALSGLQEAGLVLMVGAMGGRPGPATAIYDMNAHAGHVAG